MSRSTLANWSNQGKNGLKTMTGKGACLASARTSLKNLVISSGVPTVPLWRTKREARIAVFDVKLSSESLILSAIRDPLASLKNNLMSSPKSSLKKKDGLNNYKRFKIAENTNIAYQSTMPPFQIRNSSIQFSSSPDALSDIMEVFLILVNSPSASSRAPASAKSN